MQVCKYASMQEYKNPSWKVGKKASKHVCKYAHMQVYGNMLLCKHVNMQNQAKTQNTSFYNSSSVWYTI